MQPAVNRLWISSYAAQMFKKSSMKPGYNKFFVFAIVMMYCSTLLQGQYIKEVLEYTPAPGQYINTGEAGSPHAALSIQDSLNGLVNLGAYGGYIIFRFDKPVENDPDNPYGVDFTIFGNPLTDWSEPGIVSVMKDMNNNGLADDTWYELAGSDHYFSTTRNDYEITYTNPHESQAADISWTDNNGNSGYIFANSYHTQQYYPLSDSFPDIDNNSYTLAGTLIAGAVNTSDPASIKSYHRAFGYADNQPRSSGSYEIPDNPYTRIIENSGGDAFDISWAIDEEGNYTDLDEIHFIKVHNAIMADAGPLGELSTEIAGAIDIPPDNSITGIQDMIVIKDMPAEIDSSRYQIEVFVFHKGRLVRDKEINWTCSIREASIDDNNILYANNPGELTITASLAENPAITASATIIITESQVAIEKNQDEEKIVVYPNPAGNKIRIRGPEISEISIHTLSGRLIKKINNYSSDMEICLTDIPPGIYILNTRTASGVFKSKLIKK